MLLMQTIKCYVVHFKISLGGKCVLDVRALKIYFHSHSRCIQRLVECTSFRSALELCDNELAILRVSFTQILYQNNTKDENYLLFA